MKEVKRKVKIIGGVVAVLGVIVAGSANVHVLRAEANSSQTSAETISPDSVQICIRKSGLAFVVGYGFRKIDCRKNEKLVTISRSGGGIGAQGPVGDKGPTGEKGPTGDKGQVGDQGAVGDKGPTGDKGPQGDQGMTGETGPVGPQGPQGEAGIGGAMSLVLMRVQGVPAVYTEPSSGTGVSAPGAQVTSIAYCPDGKRMFGGGGDVSTSDTGKEKTVLTSSYPNSDYSWSVTGTEISDLTAGKTMTVIAHVICEE